MNSILIISDNHFDDIKEIILDQKVDYIMHLGDSLLSDDKLSNIDYKVKGNCDYNKLNEELLISILNIGNVFLTHGHLKEVNYGLAYLKKFCLSKDIKLCLYGHTHILNVEYDFNNDLLIINPGSTSKSRNDYPETYIILKYDLFKYEIIIKGVKDKKEIKTLKFKRNKKN